MKINEAIKLELVNWHCNLGSLTKISEADKVKLINAGENIAIHVNNSFAELPKDINGKPIHIGDTFNFIGKPTVICAVSPSHVFWWATTDGKSVGWIDVKEVELVESDTQEKIDADLLKLVAKYTTQDMREYETPKALSEVQDLLRRQKELDDVE